MVVRLSYDNFQTQMVVERKLILLSIAEAPFQFNNYPSDSKCDMKKVAVYDVPHCIKY